MASDELLQLMKSQQKKVMREIGGLLDAWDQVPNDAKGYVEETHPEFIAAIERIRKAMEG